MGRAEGRIEKVFGLGWKVAVRRAVGLKRPKWGRSLMVFFFGLLNILVALQKSTFVRFLFVKKTVKAGKYV